MNRINLFLTLLLMLALSACVGAPSTPGMSDYSYVPPSKIIATTPTSGLEDL